MAQRTDRIAVSGVPVVDHAGAGKFVVLGLNFIVLRPVDQVHDLVDVAVGDAPEQGDCFVELDRIKRTMLGPNSSWFALAVHLSNKANASSNHDYVDGLCHFNCLADRHPRTFPSAPHRAPSVGTRELRRSWEIRPFQWWQHNAGEGPGKIASTVFPVRHARFSRPPGIAAGSYPSSSCRPSSPPRDSRA